MAAALQSRKCISGFTLKLIALITMTIDHIAMVLVVSGPFYWPMRIIGRIAFPIYCFLLVEGYFHTHSVRRYALRLLLAAVASDIPFDLARDGFWPSWYYQNVMLTLAIGLVTVWLVDHSRGWVLALWNRGQKAPAETQEGERPALTIGQKALGWALMAVFSLVGIWLADFCNTDYGGGGVLLILLFYFFRKRPVDLCIAVLVELTVVFGGVEPFGIVAMVPILLYNGQRGPNPGGKWGQWFFYAYYPLHLGILYILYKLLFTNTWVTLPF
ncbi:MAG: conjugal transfer protein TraX [Clostridiales bacterium]|nr:conjugal transfer protein TraX [Clostridiales bacterium]